MEELNPVKIETHLLAKDLNVKEFHKICRGCLEECNTKSFFSVKYKEWALIDIFSKFTGLVVSILYIF